MKQLKHIFSSNQNYSKLLHYEAEGLCLGFYLFFHNFMRFSKVFEQFLPLNNFLTVYIFTFNSTLFIFQFDNILIFLLNLFDF